MDSNNWWEPQSSGKKRKYGVLNVFVNKVTLKSGASYTIPGVKDDSGALREFKGKYAGGDAVHIVLELKIKNREGGTYTTTRDMVTFDKKWTEIVVPSLQRIFGKNLGVLPNRNHYVCVEEVVDPYGKPYKSRLTGEDTQGVTWSFVEKFDSEEAMNKAERDYFARFEKAEATPEVKIDPDLVEALKIIWGNSKGNTDSFIATITSMGFKTPDYQRAILAAVGAPTAVVGA